jgi:excisionase family DNA binding protein
MSLTDAIALPLPLVERLTGVLEKLSTQLEAGAAKAANLGDALLTFGEVAQRLQKSERDVQRLVKAGKLKKVPNLGNRTTRFRPADVERLVADRENQPGRRRL